MFARNNDVYFGCAILDASFNFGDFLRERIEAGREACRHSSDRDAGALQCCNSGGNEVVVHAHGSRRKFVRVAHIAQQLVANRLARFRAEALHCAYCVVAAERGEIDRFDSVNQPRGLMLFLDGAARRHRARTTLDGTAVYAHVFDRTKIEFGAGIAAFFLGGMRRTGNVELGDFGHENPRK